MGIGRRTPAMSFRIELSSRCGGSRLSLPLNGKTETIVHGQRASNAQLSVQIGDREVRDFVIFEPEKVLLDEEQQAAGLSGEKVILQPEDEISPAGPRQVSELYPCHQNENDRDDGSCSSPEDRRITPRSLPEAPRE